MRIKIIAVLIVMLVISTMLAKLNLSAQEDSPSLSVTVQFLKDNAEFVYDIGLGKYGGRKWTLESPDDCTLVWTTEAQEEVFYSTGNTYIDNLSRKRVALPTTITFSLSDINDIWANSLHAGNSNVASSLPVETSNVSRPEYQTITLSVISRRNVIKWRGGDGDRDEHLLSLKIKNNEMGERYMKALRNAVTLCEKPGREEPDDSNALPNNSSTPPAR